MREKISRIFQFQCASLRKFISLHVFFVITVLFSLSLYYIFITLCIRRLLHKMLFNHIKMAIIQIVYRAPHSMHFYSLCIYKQYSHHMVYLFCIYPLFINIMQMSASLISDSYMLYNVANILICIHFKWC